MKRFLVVVAYGKGDRLYLGRRRGDLRRKLGTLTHTLLAISVNALR